MDVKTRSLSSANRESREEEMEVRKGPWTTEEDSILFNYITSHGEGRWNTLARCTGLKRTGKSCRLRWLNYLRPSVRRGNITLQEQLLILELHFRWGNRWSKIAKYLPGRTDNEIKNYWRTRVQKQAKQLNYDVNSKQFRDAMRYVWMPRLLERIQSSTRPEPEPGSDHQPPESIRVDPNYYTATLSESVSDRVQVSPGSDVTECWNRVGAGEESEQLGLIMQPGGDGEVVNGWVGGGESLDGLWDEDDMWFLQQQFEFGGDV